MSSTSDAATTSYSTIAVVSTGAYAEHFLKALVKSKQFTKVRAVTRKAGADEKEKLARISELVSLGAELHEYTEDTAEAFKAAFADIEVVVSAVGVSAVSVQVPMIDGAIAAGVRWFFPSEFGVAHYESKLLPFKGPLDHMIDIQEYLEKTAKPAGLAYTIVYTGLAMDYLNPQSIGLIIPKHAATLVGRGGSKVSFTTLKDTVTLLLDILSRPQEMQNRTIRYAGSTTNMRELVKLVTGNNRGENVKILSVNEAKSTLCHLAQKKDMMAFFMYCRILIEEGLAQIDRNPGEHLDNNLFPEIKPEHIFETITHLIKESEAQKNAGAHPESSDDAAAPVGSANKAVSPAAE
ncbi:hypothetical protein LPJ73_002282 [Coemansia sp. RSA 2703]|nr:hypothetical protein LPJ73_002282 [Coemansia sp. RSA 2703]KAJ2374999.1 hypothetical protein IW150_002792 [Coemansia sp. RSA 2607]